ncbi:dTDP-4-dehydrorhamnose 3,5-epimerase [Cupriavidus sp. D384]|uniref:dTDP-4-dehydrorhamnose 3,5-epimerase n=1 Tax=Cupriavidus sp. D384 TaxID=1538095 RepID=UPI00082D64B2|nr:dTDP-4-dehydrorhamnose 3,5-epimerase [Cupriavidus sp. D384]
MSLNVIRTSLEGVLVLEPKVFGDTRGFFFESFNARKFAEATGVDRPFVQDNHSRSSCGVLRGLHYQICQAQGKLVRVTEGEVFDVAVDVRRSSPTFGKWTSALLSAENKRQMWVPEGFAHGFVVVSATAEVQYKTTDYWYPEHERSIRWNDPTLAIDWPNVGKLLLADKDRNAPLLEAAEVFA